MTELCVHGVNNVRVSRIQPKNANFVCIELGSDRGKTEISIWGLPTSVTNKLMLAFADERTVNLTPPADRS